jgi:transcriptional regulator
MWARVMTSRQTELAKRICTPLQRKVMFMREKYAVEEVAKSLNSTTAEIDQIEAEGWLKLGSHHLTATPDTLSMMRAENIHPDAIT